MRGLLDDPRRRRQLEHDGFSTVPLLSGGEVERLAAVHAELATGIDTPFHTTLWSRDLECRRRAHAAMWEVCGEALERVLPGHRLCLANFAVKQPGEQGQCPLHRDWSFVDETRFTSWGVWAPLTDVDRSNGCLAVLPGSHTLGRGVRPNHAAGLPWHPYRSVGDLLRDKKLEPLPLTAGQAVVYHPGLLYGSPPNLSGLCRVAMVTMHVPADAPLMHYYRCSLNTIDAYEVDDDFYWRDCVIGARPTGLRPVARIEQELRPPEDPWRVLEDPAQSSAST